MTVIGIDPGSRCLGWGVVREASGVLSLVDCGAIKPQGACFEDRLGDLFLRLAAVLDRLKPREAAVEHVFTHKNILSALKLGQARGAAVAACAARGIAVSGYEPTLIKKTLVGTGRAEKTQVSFMVARMLNVKGDWPLDTGDALACAICHCTMRRLRKLAAL